MKMAVFRVYAPCSLLEVHRRFRNALCLHNQGDRLDDVGGELNNGSKLFIGIFYASVTL